MDEKFNPLLFIRLALLGMRKKLLSSELLWYCTQCYTCYARCPQDVRFTDVMAILRDMAIEEGYAPKDMNEKAKRIGLLSQKLRHAMTEYAWSCSAGEKRPDLPAVLRKELSQGLKELE